MKSVSADVKFNARATRVELLVRIIWGLAAGIVLAIFSFVALIIWIIQIFYILIYARRHKGMQSFIKTVVIARYRLETYIFLLTDERPPIIPESMPA